MKVLDDLRVLEAFAPGQRGVFSTRDLQIALRDPQRASFSRRVDALIGTGRLRRFQRGWYVAEEFDLATLSQRLAPESVVSFANVLARRLLIGPAPRRQVMATKVGRGRTHRALGVEIVHLSVSPELLFGFEVEDGVRWADAEKAVLDTLYFHLRGRRYSFDLFSDIDFDRLDEDRLRSYLERYRNPKFVKFARGVLEL